VRTGILYRSEPLHDALSIFKILTRRACPLRLGLFRLDYLLHPAGHRLSLKQDKFNAISSSFGHHEIAVAVFILDIVGKIRSKIHGII
jgi:hypothetical protein